MFGLKDLFMLAISAFIILPISTFIREAGYFIISSLFGVKNPRLTIGSGPRLFKLKFLDVRKYYHVHSWFTFDSIRSKSKFAYICIYAGPILINFILALTINAFLANGYLQEGEKFWNLFIFYSLYFVLYDAIPMNTVNGKPNNGMIIYELLRYGKRIDYNTEPLIVGTTEAEKEHEQEVKEFEKTKEELEKSLVQERKKDDDRT
ncbi:hypothetical protein DV702_07720 [Sporosarcina sp. PTS2304]|uniref:hypothetical protein n=1 Tax=Sporosarcina sp. PTS2304 TaxID=2283194 RepID=UPI000E0DAFD4|nr:hypothetical protein [Sporosarcina sp. PTS2304]AXH99647.1 hypothetical protein DV702_07720 [Sporosarcina sp. PTS2304]